MEATFLPTPFQEGLYASWRRDPHATAYNLPLFWRLRGPLDVAKLERACNALLAEAEPFRIKFRRGANGAGGLTQAVAPFVPQRLQVMKVGPVETDEVYRRFVRSFDLEGGPLLRVELWDVGADEWILCVDCHHAIADDGTIAYVKSALSGGYRGEEPPKVGTVFREFCRALRAPAAAAETAASADFWRGQFAAFAEGVQPAAASSGLPAALGRESGYARAALGGAALEALRAAATAHDVTVGNLIFAAVAFVMATAARTDRSLLSVPVRLPQAYDLPPAPGVFINTLIIGIKVDDHGAGLFPWVRQVGAAFFEGYEHAAFPFAQALQLLSASLGKSHVTPPPFFSYRRDGSEELTLEGVEAEELHPTTGSPKTGLTWMTREGAHLLEILLEHDRAGVKRGLAEALAEATRDFLLQATETPEASLDLFRQSGWARGLAERSLAPQDPEVVPAGAPAIPPSLTPSLSSTGEDRIEREILTQWQNLLERDDLQLDENFFDAGGDSLLLLRLETKLIERFPQLGKNLNLFQYPTVAEQAAHVRAASDDGRTVDTAPAPPTDKHRARLGRRRAS